ncbi:glutaredoxin family protein [Salipaludibacillus daqingensis]|uniref:glutaredoxin family protein n=1 Tax=Salipaludibacillus daqingensis TaxID=3041001 RepID=UPI00247713E6|nr:glutaredoxin family protein [Salipaludibacillus daqingensis]
MVKSILYTMTGCSRCHEVKKHLKKVNMTYIEKNILEDPESIQALMKITGEVFTPVLIVDNKHVLNQQEIFLLEKDELKLHPRECTNKSNR